MIKDIKPKTTEKNGVAQFDSGWQFDVSEWRVRDAERFLLANSTQNLAELRVIISENVTGKPAHVDDTSPEGLSDLRIAEWQKAIDAILKAVSATFQR